MRKHRHKDKQTGFSLLELMATVAVGGILLAIGLPSFVNLIKSNRLTTQTNSVLTALGSSIQFGVRVTGIGDSNTTVTIALASTPS